MGDEVKLRRSARLADRTEPPPLARIDPRIGDVWKLQKISDEMRTLGVTHMYYSGGDYQSVHVPYEFKPIERPSHDTVFRDKQQQIMEEEFEFWNDKSKVDDFVRSMEKKRKARLKEAKNEVKDLLKQDARCSLAALQYYNQKHGTDYEIVDTLGSYGTFNIFDNGFYFHCNFKAKLKNKISPNLFFAELFSSHPDITCKSCLKLGGLERATEIVRGCGVCGDELDHPVGGFKVGLDAGCSYRGIDFLSVDTHTLRSVAGIVE